MIDEKIGDLETLSNPTVGLAAHTGVVDVRITAKAKSESAADELIAEVEKDVRARLGNAVFGVGDDRLEEVVLDALAKRGWTLVTVELGLAGLLAEALPQTASFPDLNPANLIDTVRAAHVNSKADVALGVSADAETRSADMVLITPRGEKTHRIQYGGPPRSLPRWAVNLALNWLRTVAEESEPS